MLKTKKQIVIYSSILLLLVGTIDYFLQYEIASMPLYILPVFLFSYQNKISIKFVIVFSLIAGLIWFLTNYATYPHANDIYLMWNSLTRVSVFLLIAYVLKRINTEKEQRVIISIQKQELIEINRELLESNLKLNHFIGAAAHDIRNPIGNIISFSELLINNLNDVDQRYQLLNIINDSAKKALLILNDTLYLCQVNAGTLKLNKTNNEYIQFIKECILLNNYLAYEKEQRIHFKSSLDSIVVQFDKPRLEQVMTNLLTNAIKYSDFGTQITVVVKYSAENPEYLETEIIDHGMGIDDEYKLKIGEPFFTTPNVPTGKESKTGLGLAISKQIIELHNGTLDFYSKKDEGSTFFFTIPL